MPFSPDVKLICRQFQNDPTPLQPIGADQFSKYGIQVYLKRDDLLHRDISGNKWRKLKYNLLEASKQGYSKLLTFGGAYSNHLTAVAAAGKIAGFKTVGVVRGEKCGPLNKTLSFAEACGMELIYTTRANFRQKNHIDILAAMNFDPAGHYILPEGGANCLALKGCREIVVEIEQQLGKLPGYVCVANGTGATLAGILGGLKGEACALGVSVLKGDFLTRETIALMQACGLNDFGNWSIRTDYHFGGYAKFTPSLIRFINNFKKEHGVQLDPVYTGKLFAAVFDLAGNGFFKKGSTVVIVHTGGLQGIAGFNERFGNLIET